PESAVPPPESQAGDRPTREHRSFAEVALTLGGKSQEEARRTGEIDRADDEVEQLFLPQRQTSHSPAFRAVWERGVPVDQFRVTDIETPDYVQRVMDDSVEIVRRRRAQGELLDESHKLREDVLQEL